MRVPEAPTIVGSITVAIDGSARHAVRLTQHWAILTLGLRWLDDAADLGSFEIAAEDQPDRSLVITLSAPGDPGRLVALVRTTAHTFALPASPSATDATEWVFVADGGVTSVQVLELRDEDALALCLEWFGGPPGMGAGPEPEAEELPEPEPDAEPEPEPEPQVDWDAILEAAGDGDVSSATDDTAFSPDGEFGEESWQPSGSRVPRPPPAVAPPTAPPVTAPVAPPPVEESLPEPTTVTAHVAAEMPQSARVGEVVSLDFRVSPSAIAATPGRESDEGIIAAVPDLPLSVSISLRGYRLASGTATRSMRLPRAGVARRTFRLEATDEGRAEVSVVVRQGTETPLATLRLTSHVGAGGSPGPTMAHNDTRTPDPGLEALPIIRVDESVSQGRSTLDVAVQIDGERVQAVQRDIDKTAVIETVYARIADLRGRLDDDKSSDVAARVAVALEELRRIGVDLSRQLFPLRVRRFLWKHRDRLDGLVIQTTGEFDVPWELLYVSDPLKSSAGQQITVDGFLGMRGATRWVHNTALPTEVSVAGARAKYLCPSYRDRGLSLAFSAGEAGMLRRAFGARAVRPGDAAAMSKVIAQGFDLLHFGGHGVWTTDPPDQRLLFANYRRAGKTPAGSSFSASDLRDALPDLQMVTESSSRRMVFLNACDVGRMDSSAPGLGGFPEAFLRGGVGVLVGCSWAIDDEAAGQFVRDFYDALPQTDVAGAVILARRKALANADLTALAYVAYAHPRARIITA